MTAARPKLIRPPQALARRTWTLARGWLATLSRAESPAPPFLSFLSFLPFLSLPALSGFLALAFFALGSGGASAATSVSGSAIERRPPFCALAVEDEVDQALAIGLRK